MAIGSNACLFICYMSIRMIKIKIDILSEEMLKDDSGITGKPEELVTL
jgi:hypothetical protein